MAARKEAVEFNKILQEGREKVRNQKLADQLLGSGRRSSASNQGHGGGGSRKPPSGPSSLASRMGISKASQSPKPGFSSNKRTNDTRPGRPQAVRPNMSQQRSVSTPQISQRNQAFASVVNGVGSIPKNVQNQVNIRQRPANGAGLSIRGMAAGNTYTIVAQNFALGTTAADIQEALCPDEAVAGLVRCRLVASNPTVIAEVILTNEDLAYDIIETYNNRMADGRLLYVYMKNQPPGPRKARAAPVSIRAPIDDDMMELDNSRDAVIETKSHQQYDAPLGLKAAPEVQDGRYGFSDTRHSESFYQSDQYDERSSDRKGRGASGGNLVSDGMLRRGNGTSRYYRQ